MNSSPSLAETLNLFNQKYNISIEDQIVLKKSIQSSNHSFFKANINQSETNSHANIINETKDQQDESIF